MSVVVGYVPTPEGESALSAGVRAARELGAPLVVVNVEGSRGVRTVSGTPRDYLKALDTILQNSRVPHEVLHPVGDYDPAEEILKTAETRQAHLIVLGLRPRTPVGKLLLGSTAQRVLLEAGCPVLAVKAGQA